MEAEVRALGLFEKKADIFRLIDRREKMRPEAWETYATDLGLSRDQIDRLLALLADRELWKKSEECVAFVEAVNALGVGAYLEFEPTIVRGLDYYTGIVIEARDRENEFRAILGGGRYDNLVGDVGGERLPGLGYAMGDMVIALVAQKYGKQPAFRTSPTEVLVTTFDAASQAEALKLASELRAAGLKVEWYPEAAKLDRQLKYANLIGARVAAIIGPDEAAKGIVTLKDLAAREQNTFQRAHLVAEIQRLLASKP
jgi:histidyl-tRNA synthetase